MGHVACCYSAEDEPGFTRLARLINSLKLYLHGSGRGKVDPAEANLKKCVLARHHRNLRKEDTSMHGIIVADFAWLCLESAAKISDDTLVQKRLDEIMLSSFVSVCSASPFALSCMAGYLLSLMPCRIINARLQDSRKQLQSL